ncbi:hypothetical protein AB1Y20_018248 [Prymnesium parvum]|uniref:Monogalactosyldiacylglycerol synthase n=1 Tax=Prymnesium parvum TaxID=97485 RepID=A0AB34JQ48_PRYPA
MVARWCCCCASPLEARRLSFETERPACLVQFIVGRGGGGHTASARALRDCLLSRQVRWAAEVEFVDMGYLASKIMQGRTTRFDADELYNWLMRRGYYRLAALSGPVAQLFVRLARRKLERGLRRFWRERPPDAVVCFVPFFGTVLRASLLAVCPSTPLLTVVTDMASSCAHNWIDPYDERESANQVIVAGSATLQQQARELGYPPAHVLSTSGMVVHPSFYGDEVEAAEGGGLKKRVASPPLGGGHKGLEPVGVIFFGGFAPMRVESIARRALRSHPSLRLVVICGGNSVLRLRLQNLNEPRCVSEGFLLPERIRDIFLTADFVIGKPGPGVVAEAIVCGVPYVTENVAPMSQETCVLEYLRSSGVGVLIPSLECLPLDLLKRCAAARDRVTHLVKNRAVFEVADYLESVVKIVSE